MSEPLELHTRGPVPEVVEQLEDLLERARSGDVRGFAVAYAAADGGAVSAYEPGDASFAELHWSLCTLLRRMETE